MAGSNVCISPPMVAMRVPPYEAVGVDCAAKLAGVIRAPLWATSAAAADPRVAAHVAPAAASVEAWRNRLRVKLMTTSSSRVRPDPPQPTQTGLGTDDTRHW